MEEDTLPSRKRARIKGASVELALGQGPDVKRDEEVWFTEGNVVLQAGGVAFKVYQGILALDSEVFSGMFSMPQPRALKRSKLPCHTPHTSALLISPDSPTLRIRACSPLRCICAVSSVQIFYSTVSRLKMAFWSVLLQRA